MLLDPYKALVNRDQMLTLETIRKMMEDRQIALVAGEIGIGPTALKNILIGRYKPRMKTLEALSHYLLDRVEREGWITFVK